MSLDESDKLLRRGGFHETPLGGLGSLEVAEEDCCHRRAADLNKMPFFQQWKTIFDLPEQVVSSFQSSSVASHISPFFQELYTFLASPVGWSASTQFFAFRAGFCSIILLSIIAILITILLRFESLFTLKNPFRGNGVRKCFHQLRTPDCCLAYSGWCGSCA